MADLPGTTRESLEGTTMRNRWSYVVAGLSITVVGVLAGVPGAAGGQGMVRTAAALAAPPGPGDTVSYVYTAGSNYTPQDNAGPTPPATAFYVRIFVYNPTPDTINATFRW